MFNLGTATIDITPPVGIPLLGYSRDQPAQGILDRLQATAFALCPADAPPHLLLSLDHVGMVPDEVTTLKAHLSRNLSLKPSQITLLFSHTHAGPATSPTSTQPLIQAYQTTLQANLVHVATAALTNPQPCHAGWSMEPGHIGRNRRAQTAARPPQPGITLSRPVDERVGVLAFRHATDDHLLGLLLVVTAHPNVLRGDNLLISADYPGAVRHLLADVTGCPVMTVIGSAGDSNARWRGSVVALERMAQTIAGSVLKVLPNIETAPVTRFDVRETAVRLPLQDVPSADQARHLAATAAEAWDVSTDVWLQQITALREAGQHMLSVQPLIRAISINNGTLTGIPMEPFASYALDIMHRLDDPLYFFVGYMNGWLAYLPSAEEIPCGGYEIEWNPIVYGHESGVYMPLLPAAEHIVLDAVLAL